MSASFADIRSHHYSELAKWRAVEPLTPATPQHSERADSKLAWLQYHKAFVAWNLARPTSPWSGMRERPETGVQDIQPAPETDSVAGINEPHAFSPELDPFATWFGYNESLADSPADEAVLPDGAIPMHSDDHADHSHAMSSGAASFGTRAAPAYTVSNTFISVAMEPPAGLRRAASLPPSWSVGQSSYIYALP